MPNPDYIPPEYALPLAIICGLLYILIGWKRRRG